MRTARSIALAAAVATIPACTGGAPCDTYFGYPRGEMPDLDMLVGDTVETPLADYWDSPECIFGGLVFEARSSDPAAVAVSVSDTDSVLTTIAIEDTDSVRVTVQSIDSGLLHEFLVHVRPR